MYITDMHTKRNKTLRYKVIIGGSDKQVIRKFATADEIVEALGSGLSKDIVYRKVKISAKQGHAYTGFRRTKHRHILIERIKKKEWGFRDERGHFNKIDLV